jgi:hypothetical protein
MTLRVAARAAGWPRGGGRTRRKGGEAGGGTKRACAVECRAEQGAHDAAVRGLGHRWCRGEGSATVAGIGGRSGAGCCDGAQQRNQPWSTGWDRRVGVASSMRPAACGCSPPPPPSSPSVWCAPGMCHAAPIAGAQAGVGGAAPRRHAQRRPRFHRPPSQRCSGTHDADAQQGPHAQPDGGEGAQGGEGHEAHGKRQQRHPHRRQRPAPDRHGGSGLISGIGSAWVDSRPQARCGVSTAGARRSAALARNPRVRRAGNANRPCAAREPAPLAKSRSRASGSNLTRTMRSSLALAAAALVAMPAGASTLRSRPAPQRECVACRGGAVRAVRRTWRS